MPVIDEARPKTVKVDDADYFADLDSLVYRTMNGKTTTETGLRRRLAEVAEDHGKLYAEARVHLPLRFKLLRNEGAITEAQVGAIPRSIRSFLGGDDKS